MVSTIDYDALGRALDTLDMLKGGINSAGLIFLSNELSDRDALDVLDRHKISLVHAIAPVI